ncbi:MAG: tetratricopeptide repeat protein [Thermoanaerobaculia bacterium]
MTPNLQMTETSMKRRSQSRSEYQEAMLNKALDLRDAGDFPQALELLRDLTTDAPDDLDSLFYYGTILFHLDRYQEATEVFHKFLEHRPKNEPASLALFLSLWHLGRRREAGAEMKRFMALSDSREYSRLLSEIEEAWNADQDIE